METFSALLALYAGNSPIPGEFPTQKPVTRSFDISMISTLNKRLSKHRETGDLKRHRARYDVIVVIVWVQENVDHIVLYVTPPHICSIQSKSFGD